MKQKFLKSNDPRLTQAAIEVPVDAITAPETKQDIDSLFALAHPEQADRNKPVLVGVAASQVGIPKRIVLIDVAADGHGGTGDLRTYINPVITQFSPQTDEWYEGCYSTAPLCGVVSRPTTITVEAYAADGHRITETHSGYIARIFQHELDHLDGRVFIDRISNDDHLHWVEEADYPRYRDQEGWRNWPRKFPREQWQQMRSAS